MPDEAGNIRGITVPAEAWERIFSNKKKCECNCHDPEWIGTPGCWCSCDTAA